MLKILLATLLLFTNAYALQIKELLPDARAGDWLITQQNKNYTMLAITGVTPQEITIEEITIPKGRLPSKFSNWRSWAESGASGHTCWVRYQVNKNSGALRNMYSLSQGSWIQVSPSENIFSTLINLSFSALPPSKRKMIVNRSGVEKPWQPKLTLDGRAVPQAEFSAWVTSWPKDSSELSGKQVQAYLPSNIAEAPSYFPYWLKISGTVGKATLRVTDSGRNLNL